MNLFNGMSDHQVVSTILAFALFNGFVLLEVISLAAFYVTSKPRRGRVRTAALFHIGASIVFLMCLISTVWAAPAEKSFINETTEAYFDVHDPRFQKVIIGVLFAAIGISLLLIGAVVGSRQRRALAEEALLTA